MQGESPLKEMAVMHSVHLTKGDAGSAHAQVRVTWP